MITFEDLILGIAIFKLMIVTVTMGVLFKEYFARKIRNKKQIVFLGIIMFFILLSFIIGEYEFYSDNSYMFYNLGRAIILISAIVGLSILFRKKSELFNKTLFWLEFIFMALLIIIVSIRGLNVISNGLVYSVILGFMLVINSYFVVVGFLIKSSSVPKLNKGRVK